MHPVARAAWAVAALAVAALAVYLVVYRWADVGGNLEAQAVITAPAFVTHHLLIRRHVARQHEQTQQALAAATAQRPEGR